MTIALALLRHYWLHALVLAALVWGGYKAHAYVWQNGYNAANVRAEQIIAEMARAEADAQARARKAEQDAAVRVAEIAEQYERDKADAQAAADRVAADLRAGNIRLRDEWAGCETDRVSGDARTAAELDAVAAARERLAAEIVQTGREADDWIKRLQDYAREVSRER